MVTSQHFFTEDTIKAALGVFWQNELRLIEIIILVLKYNGP